MAKAGARGKAPNLDNFDVSLAAVGRVYFYFWRFARPYYPHLILISALMLVQIPVDQLARFLIRDVTDQALLATDRTTSERMAILFQIAVVQAGLWMSGELMWKFRELLNWYLFMRGTFDLRLAFYEHLHKLPLSFLRQRPPGEHLYRSTSDIMSNHNDPFDLGLMGMVAWTVLPIVETIYTLGWAGFFLFQISPVLAWAVAIYIVPYSLTAHLLIGWQRKVVTRRAYLLAQETAIVRDSVGGLRAVRSMGKAAKQRHRFTGIANAVAKIWVKHSFLATFSNDWVLWLVRYSFNGGVMLFMAHEVVHGRATVGEFVAAPLIVETARGPVERLVGALQSIRIWTVNGQRVMQTLTVEPDLQDPPNPVILPNLDGKVEFQDVTLDYDEGNRALHSLSLSIAPGEVVGFVGPSGAGKSSVLNVLLRLYPATSGRVFVDGHDVRDIKIASLLKQVALVPQSTFLYDGSIRENVQFGDPHASDDEILEALHKAGAAPLLDRLDDGLDYIVGDATTISGGEKQRIGIARAMVRDPRLLILDEATANLDPITEEGVLQTLESTYAGRTVLIVAHRLKAVAKCDRIVVLDRGRIVAVGTHTELMSQNPWYRQRWAEQQSGKNLEEAEND